ncbi:MAG: hypothetical protein ACHQE6_07375 [Solirubrobacterales bacterium]
MLAYLLWHRPADGIEREAYERACERFHRSLHRSPPAGLRGSAVFRVGATPWLAPAPPGESRPADPTETQRCPDPAGEAAQDGQPQLAYEDWYLLEDFAALGVLNEAAVAHGHRSAHDGVARRFGAGAGGLYSLLEGHVDLAGAPLAVWVARPPGVARRAMGELLGDGIDPEHASLWRRQLVLGPAPEYCLLTREPPAGVAPTRLPNGWRATVCERELLWCG